jgi:hypothetical protein
VKIVSGDAAATVRHLVEALKVPARGTLTGAEIARMNDAMLAAKAQRTDVFARVSPDQKVRIIRALQARGHSVGFIGDGINDAPAIRAADAGLAVDGATDVARAAADMILLASDLGVVADGVAEGRRTYANIMKYLRMGTSSNFGNMVSMAVASLFIPFLPLTPIQVLLNNLLYDLGETGIPFDADHGTIVVAVRHRNLRAAAARLPRRARNFPYRLVRRIDGDADSCYLPHSYCGAGVDQPSASAACLDLARRVGGGSCARTVAGRRGVRVHGFVVAAHRHNRWIGGRISRYGGIS